jgi:FkbH-like protein
MIGPTAASKNDPPNLQAPEMTAAPSVYVCATFVAEPIQDPLEWLLAEIGVAHDVRFAPYNQVFQQLLDPGSELGRNKNNLNVIFVRLEDFIRDRPAAEISQSVCDRIVSDLVTALERFSIASSGHVLLGVLDPTPHPDSRIYQMLLDLSASLRNRVRQFRGVHILNVNDESASSDSFRYDEAQDRLAHIPYTAAHFAYLALAASRMVHEIRVSPAKVLVLDCDNTIWKGVVGEDGIQGIAVTDAYRALQEFAVAQQAKGVLVCLASKNVEADVLEVLEKHEGMQLRAAHVVSTRINWHSKADNLRSLAAELNLGLDSFVFLDDNPVECGQMRAELPEVITIQVPTEDKIRPFLSNLWMFDKLALTSEDANRTRMYKENSARRAVETSVGDIGQFIAALELKIDIAAPGNEEWGRLEQLTQRTNQFNFTTRRRSVLELQDLMKHGAEVVRVRVSDRFGDYGLVGLMILQPADGALQIDTLLLSCRVLGRGVEHAMLRHAGVRAQAMGLGEVQLSFIKTPRNVPARAFADSVAARFAETSEIGALYRMPTDFVTQIVHLPGQDPEEVLQARAADEKKPVAITAAHSMDRSDRYSRIAELLVSGDAILAQMASRPPRHRSSAEERIPPANALETELLQLWEELLAIEGLGVNDDYFAMGGTSLLSVKLFAEITRRYGIQLRLTTILDAPTVRALSSLIASSAGERRGLVVRLRPGGAHNLFLVHDGLGETLLYLNLARNLPSEFTVFGIEPKRLPGIPMAFANIEDMAAYYVDELRSIQPHGPYLIAGMCAGGVIAFQMAARLTQLGESVAMVGILDGATPQAVKRSGRITRDRLSRLREYLAVGKQRNQWIAAAVILARKAWNVLAYETTSRLETLSVRLRFALLRALVTRNSAWPQWLPELSVLEIYNALESRYTPPALPDVPVVLVRASRGVDNDTPYREIYSDEAFGWRVVSPQVRIVDVSGGHSSMLQGAFVDSLASIIVAHSILAELRPLAKIA